ncbi:MAG TPA: amidohydrolase/deacetylase family metallohydrolase [Bryobacteraceae bacterium]|nr:amidohydrolase/deacetylase family metallohydrolase [Bryobacteraceae bacterium]
MNRRTSCCEIMFSMRMPLLLLFACVLKVSAQAEFDLLLDNGHVVDGRNGVDGVRDVAIRAGRIAAVAPAIEPARAARVIDVKGLYVVPGLIDIHVHVFHTSLVPNAWAGDNSVQPDTISFRTGVTTMVDAGSSGYRNFPQFRATVIDRAQTRILAMLNIAGYGMMTNLVEQDTQDMIAAKTAAVARQHKDVVVGIKSAHFEGAAWTSVDRAIEAGKEAGIPIMVDFGWFRTERPYWQLVTQRLRPGDISTHMFRGPVPWADAKGKLYPYLAEARKRGVLFDVGHGGGSFVMRHAVPAIAQGFWPDTISTDLHSGSMNAGMMDMPTTMSKLLALGMPLKEVLVRSTDAPARAIGRNDLGHLTPGAVADVAVLRLMEGDFAFRDEAGASVRSRQRLHPEMTFKDGRVVWDWNSRTGQPWQELPSDYGIRKGVDHVVPPPAGTR